MSPGIGSIGAVSAPHVYALPKSQDVREAADAAKSKPVEKGSFGDVVSQALNSLQSLQEQADAAALDFATGGGTELHDVMIATEKLNLGFQLTLQLRNKMVESYQEIMRMQV